MFNYHNIYRKILKLPIKLLTKSIAIPSNPIKDLELDLNRPIVYVLPYVAQSDLLILQQNAIKAGLPDPLEPLEINQQKIQRYSFIFNTTKSTDELPLFQKLLECHHEDKELDIQLVPVSILWGRKPGKEHQNTPVLKNYNFFQKFWVMLTLGRDTAVRLSPSVSLRYMADKHGTDATIAKKLIRVAKIHFSRQKLAAAGPKLPQRKQLINRLLKSESITKIIQSEAKARNTSVAKVEKEAKAILDEIASSFSYNMIRISGLVLNWLWNKLYQGIEVNHAEKIRRLAQDGHELVYVPCHRSHTDYLLLSYILYHQGLVPPHIAAGINLNFFPAGFIFRHGGAFFIRRSFKGNKLYSTIFREYLAQLFTKGYSVEFFAEGGRSRTGRLLPAKTGMLAMTIEAMLRGLNRPVTIVPVYIGYEQVIEVSTYAKELQGKKKEKENINLVFRTFKKLRNLGKGYVNFGEPITINKYLNKNAPNWQNSINMPNGHRPTWMNDVVNNLSKEMMININSAAATNGLTLCAMALLASRQRTLSKEELINQVDCYLNILNNVTYSNYVSIPKESAEQLVEHAKSIDMFNEEQDSLGIIYSLDRKQSIFMTYYRNNIIHLFALPSLISQIILAHQSLSLTELYDIVTHIYPFIKDELFIKIKPEELVTYIDKYLQEFKLQQLIEVDEFNVSLITSKIRTLQLLGRSISETLHRYNIVLNILKSNPQIEKVALAKESQIAAQRLSRLHGINAPEFFDKKVLNAFVGNLKDKGYLDKDNSCENNSIGELSTLVSALISSGANLTIQAVIASNIEKS